jgi:hypothetical protein
MSVFHARSLAPTTFALALVGTISLAACDDNQDRLPTGPSAQPAELPLKTSSKKDLIAFVSDRDGNQEIYTL